MVGTFKSKIYYVPHFGSVAQLVEQCPLKALVESSSLSRLTMFYLIVYLLAIFSLLIFLISISIYTLFLIYSSIKGSPYVPTKKKELEVILGELQPKKEKLMIELGSGDGRMLRLAAKTYGLNGTGIDINPLLNFWANLLWKLSSKNSKSSLIFKTENVFDTDYRKADYLYIFLMPKLIAELTPKLNEELKKGAIVISHGFPILTWKRKLYKTLGRKPFPTYFYCI